jgi:ADP-heptose:LPS heptosyltransferase
MMKRAKIPQDARILIIALNGIGNLILATPIITNIKKNLPKAKVSVLTLRDSRGVLEQSEQVEELITFPAEKSLSQRLQFLIGLRKRGYDVSIYPYPNVNIMSAIMGLLIGARKKVNFDYKVWGKFVTFLNDISVPVDYDMHDVDKNLKVVKALGLKVHTKEMLVGITKDDEKKVVQLLKRHIKPRHIVVAMHMGSKEQLRVWPAENFAKVAEALSQHSNVKIVLIGKGTEREAAESYPQFKAKNIINLIDKLTIPETTVLLKRCRLLIGNDSGPMHMAAAVGTQTLIVYLGPHVRRTVPYGKKHVVFVAERDPTYVDKNPNHIYVDKVTPRIVVAKAKELLKLR